MAINLQTDEKQVVQGPSRQPSPAGAKVVVACKLPHGIRMRPFKMMPEREQTPMGTREIQIARPCGDAILIHGNAVSFGAIPAFKIVRGFALTEGVDRDTWRNWFEANQTGDMVRNGLIFAEDTVERAVSRANECGKLLSGLEPFRKEGDPRAPRSVRPEVGKISQEDEQASRAA
jgi:hypothetical protein